MSDNTLITRDPIYYVTVAFFAMLTTALPALMGQPRFLPIAQTLALTTFVAVTLHQRHFRGALNVMAIWVPIQFALMTVLTRLFMVQIEAAFTDGFLYRGAITAWFFGGASYPGGLSSDSMGYLIEVAIVVLGSLVTAGLAGTWILVRIVNQAAYGTGILMASLANPVQSMLVLPYWTMLPAAGYAGLIVLCAEPLLTYNWSPGYYWRNHRQAIMISVGLVILGIVLELFLPDLVARPPLA